MKDEKINNKINTLKRQKEKMKSKKECRMYSAKKKIIIYLL